MPDNRRVKKCINRLKKKHLLITTAESLTGGMIAKTIVDIPGASLVFEEGYVTYSNFAKVKNLSVNSETITNNGVVSKEVALDMANGALHRANSDFALATTGVAGPDSDEFNTPVGTVYIACASKKHIIVRKYLFKGNRDSVRKQATNSAFKLLWYMLKHKL